MNENNYVGKIISPTGGLVVKRKAGFEKPIKKIEPEAGLIVSDILKKLKKEAVAMKKVEEAEITAEIARLNNIFKDKKDLH